MIWSEFDTFTFYYFLYYILISYSSFLYCIWIKNEGLEAEVVEGFDFLITTNDLIVKYWLCLLNSFKVANATSHEQTRKAM